MKIENINRIYDVPSIKKEFEVIIIGLAASKKALSHFYDMILDRKSTRLNSSHIQKSRMPSSA